MVAVAQAVEQAGKLMPAWAIAVSLLAVVGFGAFLAWTLIHRLVRVKTRDGNEFFFRD
jgi:hypothetical protein